MTEFEEHILNTHKYNPVTGDMYKYNLNAKKWKTSPLVSGQSFICFKTKNIGIARTHIAYLFMEGKLPPLGTIFKFRDGNSRNIKYQNIYIFDPYYIEELKNSHNNNTKPLPDVDLLKRMFSYNLITGQLRYRISGIKRKRRGRDFTDTICDEINVNGYIDVFIDGEAYLAHRIIWKIMYGKDPLHIDHKNGKLTDNRLKNLRSVTLHVNALNQKIPKHNTSGYMGVRKDPQKESRWIAYIMFNGKRRYLGSFEKIEEAVSARKEAERRLGFHVNHGRAL